MSQSRVIEKSEGKSRRTLLLLAAVGLGLGLAGGLGFTRHVDELLLLYRNSQVSDASTRLFLQVNEVACQHSACFCRRRHARRIYHADHDQARYVSRHVIDR